MKQNMVAYTNNKVVSFISCLIVTQTINKKTQLVYQCDLRQYEFQNEFHTLDYSLGLTLLILKACQSDTLVTSTAVALLANQDLWPPVVQVLK